MFYKLIMTPKSSAGATAFIQTSQHAVRIGKQTHNLTESKLCTCINYYSITVKHYYKALLHFHTFEIYHIHFGHYLDKKQLLTIMTDTNCYCTLFKNTAVKSRSCQSFEFLLENNGLYCSSVDGKMTNVFSKYKRFNLFDCYSPALEQGI